MGVVDQRYVDSTGDRAVQVGHKVPITLGEVRRLLVLVEQLGVFLSNKLGELASNGSEQTQT
jgi:hypothetical protein